MAAEPTSSKVAWGMTCWKINKVDIHVIESSMFKGAIQVLQHKDVLQHKSELSMDWETTTWARSNKYLIVPGKYQVLGSNWLFF